MEALARTALIGLVAAGMATAAKSVAEAVLQPAAERVLPPSTVAKQRPGADPGGHPGRLPPAELVDVAVRRTTGDDAITGRRTPGSQVLRRVMGTSPGPAYSALSRRVPAVRTGLGAPAGLVLSALTHATTLPAAGPQPPLRDLPRDALVREPDSHAVDGLVLETVLRLLRREHA